MFLADRVVVMSARPGRVSEDLRVTFERPRAYETLILEPAYVRLKQHILQAIRHTQEDTGAAAASPAT